MEVNEYILEISGSTREHETENASKNALNANTPSQDIENLGTQMLDASCSPSNIRYPQDFYFLNEAREKVEAMIDYFHKTFHPWVKPRTYRKVARQEYLEKHMEEGYAEKTEAELEIDKVRTDGGFFCLGNHKVTGYELNRRLETIQGILLLLIQQTIK